MKIASLLAISALALCSISFCAIASGENPVTLAFIEGCELVPKSREDIEASSEFRQQNMLLCAMTVKSALEIAASAKRFNYHGTDVCVPDAPQPLDIVQLLVRRSKQASSLAQLDPAQLTAAIIASHYNCKLQ